MAFKFEVTVACDDCKKTWFWAADTKNTKKDIRKAVHTALRSERRAVIRREPVVNPDIRPDYNFGRCSCDETEAPNAL